MSYLPILPRKWCSILCWGLIDGSRQQEVWKRWASYCDLWTVPLHVWVKWLLLTFDSTWVHIACLGFDWRWNGMHCIWSVLVYVNFMLDLFGIKFCLFCFSSSFVVPFYLISGSGSGWFTSDLNLPISFALKYVTTIIYL